MLLSIRILLEAILGRGRARTLRTLFGLAVVAVIELVPSARAAILQFAVDQERARIAPAFRQSERHLSEHLSSRIDCIDRAITGLRLAPGQFDGRSPCGCSHTRHARRPPSNTSRVAAAHR